jgi:hypothetical protein
MGHFFSHPPSSSSSPPVFHSPLPCFDFFKSFTLPIFRSCLSLIRDLHSSSSLPLYTLDYSLYERLLQLHLPLYSSASNSLPPALVNQFREQFSCFSTNNQLNLLELIVSFLFLDSRLPLSHRVCLLFSCSSFLYLHSLTKEEVEYCIALLIPGWFKITGNRNKRPKLSQIRSVARDLFEEIRKEIVEESQVNESLNGQLTLNDEQTVKYEILSQSIRRERVITREQAVQWLIKQTDIISVLSPIIQPSNTVEAPVERVNQADKATSTAILHTNSQARAIAIMPSSIQFQSISSPHHHYIIHSPVSVSKVKSPIQSRPSTAPFITVNAADSLISASSPASPLPLSSALLTEAIQLPSRQFGSLIHSVSPSPHQSLNQLQSSAIQQLIQAKQLDYDNLSPNKMKSARKTPRSKLTNNRLKIHSSSHQSADENEERKSEQEQKQVSSTVPLTHSKQSQLSHSSLLSSSSDQNISHSAPLTPTAPSSSSHLRSSLPRPVSLSANRWRRPRPVSPESQFRQAGREFGAGPLADSLLESKLRWDQIWQRNKKLLQEQRKAKLEENKKREEDEAALAEQRRINEMKETEIRKAAQQAAAERNRLALESYLKMKQLAAAREKEKTKKLPAKKVNSAFSHVQPKFHLIEIPEPPVVVKKSDEPPSFGDAKPLPGKKKAFPSPRRKPLIPVFIRKRTDELAEEKQKKLEEEIENERAKERRSVELKRWREKKRREMEERKRELNEMKEELERQRERRREEEEARWRFERESEMRRQEQRLREQEIEQLDEIDQAWRQFESSPLDEKTSETEELSDGFESEEERIMELERQLADDDRSLEQLSRSSASNTEVDEWEQEEEMENQTESVDAHEESTAVHEEEEQALSSIEEASISLFPSSTPRRFSDHDGTSLSISSNRTRNSVTETPSSSESSTSNSSISPIETEPIQLALDPIAVTEVVQNLVDSVISHLMIQAAARIIQERENPVNPVIIHVEPPSPIAYNQQFDITFRSLDPWLIAYLLVDPAGLVALQVCPLHLAALEDDEIDFSAVPVSISLEASVSRSASPLIEESEKDENQLDHEDEPEPEPTAPIPLTSESTVNQSLIDSPSISDPDILTVEALESSDSNSTPSRLTARRDSSVLFSSLRPILGHSVPRSTPSPNPRSASPQVIFVPEPLFIDNEEAVDGENSFNEALAERLDREHRALNDKSPVHDSIQYVSSRRGSAVFLPTMYANNSNSFSPMPTFRTSPFHPLQTRNSTSPTRSDSSVESLDDLEAD